MKTFMLFFMFTDRDENEGEAFSLDAKNCSKWIWDNFLFQNNSAEVCTVAVQSKTSTVHS